MLNDLIGSNLIKKKLIKFTCLLFAIVSLSGEQTELRYISKFLALVLKRGIYYMVILNDGSSKSKTECTLKKYLRFILNLQFKSKVVILHDFIWIILIGTLKC